MTNGEIVPTSPRLVRPVDGRMLGGVAAGIADRYGWSRSTIRLLMVLSILIPGPQFILYLLAWILIPSEDGRSSSAA